jgi:hypothetical protein
MQVNGKPFIRIHVYSDIFDYESTWEGSAILLTGESPDFLFVQHSPCGRVAVTSVLRSVELNTFISPACGPACFCFMYLLDWSFICVPATATPIPIHPAFLSPNAPLRLLLSLLLNIPLGTVPLANSLSCNYGPEQPLAWLGHTYSPR